MHPGSSPGTGHPTNRQHIMSDKETEDLLNKDLLQLADAKHFLGNFNQFIIKATYDHEKADLVAMKRHHTKALIRIGLENMP